MSTRYEKIKNYNQLILAIAGTVTVLFLLGFGIMVLVHELGNMFSDNSRYQEGILSEDKTTELLADSMRKQIISFNHIELIDSVNKVYVLPIGQADLIEGESANDLLGLTNRYKKISGYSYTDSHHRNSAINNILIYKSNENKSEIIFNTRVSISRYEIVEKEDKKYILIQGTNTDSNKDKYLNHYDLQDIYIYEIEKHLLTKIELKKDYTVLGIEYNHRSMEVMARCALDRNKNGEFDYGVEPIIYFKVNLEKKALVTIVQQEQINQLQKLLEGR